MTTPADTDLTRLDTWPKWLVHNSERFGASAKAMRYKHYGIWQSHSWQDYLSQVKYLALGLRSLGFNPGDRLLIVGDNSPEWFFAQMAAQCNRGISVGLYSDLSAAEVEFLAADCQANFAMVEDEEQTDKILLIRERLPHLKTVIYWRYKGLSRHDNGAFVGLRDVLELGRRYEEEHPGVFEESVAAGGADDVCAIVYTSGATRETPQGVLHSHRSLMTSAWAYYELDDLNHKDDLACTLPPAWIIEQWVAFGCHLLCGGTVNYAESSETQQEDMREIAPTIALYNSRLWENQAGYVQARLRGAGFFKRTITGWLMPVGERMAGAKLERRRPGLRWRILNVLADLLVYRPVRDSLGLPRARVCYTYGSTLSPEAFHFFHALGVPLKSIYGSAEAGAVTGAADKIQLPDAVGTVNPGVEVAFSDEGEILVRSLGAFRGYHNDPVATERAWTDGWVRTGDKGHIGPDGELVFVDRLEDLITLPCGDVVAPQDLESRLKHSPYIKDAWILAAEGCDFVSAVIIIDADNTGRWADKNKTTYTTFGDLSQKPEIYRLIEGEISTVNKGLPDTRWIGKYVNLHKEFDPDESELTRNRKLRRALLRERYPAIIKALGGDAKSVEVEAEITYQDGRVGRVTTAIQIATVGRGDR